jgi:hypothetical protein
MSVAKENGGVIPKTRVAASSRGALQQRTNLPEPTESPIGKPSVCSAQPSPIARVVSFAVPESPMDAEGLEDNLEVTIAEVIATLSVVGSDDWEFRSAALQTIVRTCQVQVA